MGIRLVSLLNTVEINQIAAKTSSPIRLISMGDTSQIYLSYKLLQPVKSSINHNWEFFTKCCESVSAKIENFVDVSKNGCELS